MTKSTSKLQEKRNAELKRIDAVVKIAHRLFAKKGYENIGMREISAEAGLSPMQLYRLGLDKRDLLAEVILKVNQKQIDAIEPFSAKEYSSADKFIESYLLGLYKKDVDIKTIRAEGAAFGWKWSAKYEVLIIEQLMRLIKPIADALTHYQYDEVQARCFAIWSLYYVGYRNAVMNNATANECLEAIKPSLKLCLKK